MVTTKEYKKYIFRYFLLAGLLVIFKQSFFELLDNTLVGPIFKKISISFIDDVFLLILPLGLSVYLTRKLNSNTFIHIGLITTFAYLTIRMSNFWNFYSTYTIHCVTYSDLVFIEAWLPFLIFLVQKNKITPDSNDDDSVGFLEDNPISDTGSDLFHRRDIASELVKLILNTKNKKAFAIGILGEYGTGKTSFLNLISTYLTLQNDKIVEIKFNPWASETTENVHKDFFEIIALSLVKVDPQLKNLIYTYSRKLSREDSGFKKIATRLNFINYLSESYIHETEYEKINNLLNDAKRKVIITIDDLDRLDDKEIFEVLKLIRNTANFGNIIYLVAYDKAHVLNSLKSLNSKTYTTYLDKIFQLEIPLPKREKEDLTYILKEKIKDVLRIDDFVSLCENIIPKAFENQYETSYRNIFRHSRDIIKFVNSFQLTYNLIASELEFSSLFILELLKFRYPQIYDILYEKVNDFLNLKLFGSQYQEFYVIKTSKSDAEIPYMVQYLSETAEKYELSAEDLILIREIFRGLFPLSTFGNTEKISNSISNPLFFDIYFRFRISKNDISDTDFRRATLEGRDSLFKLLDNNLNRNLESPTLTRLLQERNFTDKTHFEIILNAIFYFGKQYVAKRGFTSFPYRELNHFLFDFPGSPVERFYNKSKGEFNAFFLPLLENASSPYIFESGLLYYLNEQSWDFFALTKAETINYQLVYFEKLLSENGFNNEACNWLFWGVREHYFIDTSEGRIKKWRLDTRLKDSVFTHFKQGNEDPTFFLKKTIEAEFPPTNRFRIYLPILELFGVDELRDFAIQSENIKRREKEEYLSFFSLFEDDFARFIPFSFKTFVNPAQGDKVIVSST